ncbi:MAG TPA: hypothetical protein V6D46_03685 [Coleofasciculaceae cyanobacterium]
MDDFCLHALPAARSLAPGPLTVDVDSAPIAPGAEAVRTAVGAVARPIVCLECDRWQLLAEAIDHNRDRQTTWVRPIVLAEYADLAARQAGDRPETIYPSEYGVDLVLPSALFRAAFDTELLELLALSPDRPPSIAPSDGRAIFQALVRLLFAD